MSEDMSEIMKKMSDMIKNSEIPDNIKNVLNNLSSSASGTSNMQNNETSNFENNTNTNGDNDNFNIDMETMLKMKSIIDSMNRSQNDPRSNLLKSLKPYLKPSRKEKVDQYIKLFSIGKAFEMMGPLGGEKKNGL